MKRKIIFTVAVAVLALTLFNCTGKPDKTISSFADAVNANKVADAGALISETATKYDDLKNNNWSGLQASIDNWRQAGNMSFTGLSSTESGDNIIVNGTYVNDLGSKPTIFTMVKESDFLFLFYSYKIKEWRYDENSNGAATDDGFQINKIQE